jgi:hypothetical protein
MMLRMKLKNKITLGSIAISLFTSLTVLNAIAYVVKNQNAKASEEILKTAFNIVVDEIQRRQEKLWTDTTQLGNLEDIRGNIRFIRDNKSTVDNLMARDSYTILAEATHTLGKTANAWKMAVYDGDGDLSAFAVFQQKETKYGFAQGFPNAVIKAKSVGDEDGENSGDFQKIDHLEGLDLSFGHKLPEQALWRFERIGLFLCIVTHVPIMGETYNKDTGKMKTVQTGLVTGIQKLDEFFVKRLSNLTNAEINLFMEGALSVGTLAEYKALVAKPGAAELASDAGLSPESLRFNEISVTGSDYYQATLPLYTNGGQNLWGQVCS